MVHLEQVVIYIGAAVIAVPIAKRLGLGSVLGYLSAGIIIGPAALGLIGDVDQVLHFAELGVVFLLFIIGLELKPSRLWVLRRPVFGLGTAQVMTCGVVLGLIAWLAGVEPKAALVVGFGLALSSTAFVLQLLGEQKQLNTDHGRNAFAILLFQDLAVIPLIALVPLLATSDSGGIDSIQLAITVACIVALVAGARYLLRPVLRFVANSGIAELFTATALLIVIGAAVLMEKAHLSMGLGAFIAGMLLAESEYRHELESNIEPFKGLLLGLFFIAVGMSVDLSLIASRPIDVFGFTVLLILTKLVCIFGLAKVFSLANTVSTALAVVLSQGGEFAFVLFTLARDVGVIDNDTINLLIVVVTLSMATTPLLFLANEKINQWRDAKKPDAPYDEIEREAHPVVIASFGRFGQIVGRILRSRGIPFTALEASASQVEVVRRFGNKVYYGDAARIELLRAAGIDEARFFVLAIEDIEQSLRTARTIRHYCPQLPILARARNRLHAHSLMDLGIEHIYRDTFHSSLALTESLLTLLGTNDATSKNVVETFADYDERLLQRQYAFRQDEHQYMQSVQEAAAELETLLNADRKHDEAES
ncbi:MAG: monovalent cation:proton antiporter-2 (CPA2) family protein [Pseudomonadota bacterium]